MSKRDEKLVAILQVLREQMRRSSDRFLIDTALDLLTPSGSVLRQRRYDEDQRKKRVRSYAVLASDLDKKSVRTESDPTVLPAVPVARVQDSHSDSESFPLPNPSEPSSATSQTQHAAREIAGVADPDDLDAAHEPYQPPGDSVFARPTATDEAIVWLERVTGVRWPKREWRSEFEALAKKPIGEKRNAAIAMRADDWVKANPHLANPGHVVKHWPKYASGSSQAVTVERDTGDAAAERRLAARKAQDAENDARMRREMRGQYGPPPTELASAIAAMAPAIDD